MTFKKEHFNSLLNALELIYIYNIISPWLLITILERKWSTIKRENKMQTDLMFIADEFGKI